MKTSRFYLNDAQREGLAKVFDNFATALLIASVVGYFVDHKLGLAASSLLVALALMLILCSVRIRKTTAPTPPMKPATRRQPSRLGGKRRP